ncbi:hypothetical protein DPMN_182437 [Dreissena polymorpha]|uniref:Transposable element P transposase-like RNase H domain-containing protein n=1 Tax=Dreissena polymorpha TaxID=45954 RepID=A0A9D4I4K8_DREPO|nr:hypothetical protein DPMN_182437 [Dreissena polymorpha]
MRVKVIREKENINPNECEVSCQSINPHECGVSSGSLNPNECGVSSRSINPNECGVLSGYVSIEDIKKISPQSPNEMLLMLVEQSKNISRHPNGRRWSKDFISTGLQLFNRSPKAYGLLEQSKILLLPSKSVLILYKNAIKQDAGFDDACFEWMHEEALKNGMDEEHCVGGIMFDEMSIQTDIHFENNGRLLEVTGFTDIGQEGDICNKLRNGNCDKLMGTHILQLLFLGLNVFIFPFAHFVT